VPGSVAKNGLVVFECSVGRPAVPEQELDGAGIVAHSHADDATGSVGTEASEKCRMLLENSLSRGFIAKFGGLNEAEPGGAVLHQMVKERRVAELMGDHVWRIGHSEAVEVDDASGTGIALREVAFADGGADGFGIVIENALDNGNIPDSGSCEDIDLCAAGDQIRCHIVAIGLARNHVLHGGGFVIEVARVDLCSVFEE
jgi:hypothetical protein